jgi:hypothetical protein
MLVVGSRRLCARKDLLVDSAEHLRDPVSAILHILVRQFTYARHCECVGRACGAVERDVGVLRSWCWRLRCVVKIQARRGHGDWPCANWPIAAPAWPALNFTLNPTTAQTA